MKEAYLKIFFKNLPVSIWFLPMYFLPVNLREYYEGERQFLFYYDVNSLPLRPVILNVNFKLSYVLEKKFSTVGIESLFKRTLHILRWNTQ